MNFENNILEYIKRDNKQVIEVAPTSDQQWYRNKYANKDEI